MRVVRVRSRHFNSRQPSGLKKLISNFQLRDESSSGGWGLMHRIKIPQQDFALKMQGGRGLMREGGRICGTLQYIKHSSQIEHAHFWVEDWFLTLHI